MAGLGLFARGLSEALPGGIALAGEFDRQRNVKASRKMGEVMARMQSLDPFAGQDDPAQQGVPTEGQTTATNPNQGFDGNDFNQLTSEYYAAAAGLGDLRDYKAAMDLYGQFRMDKINNYVDASLAAYDSGDHAGASRALRGASAFMSPGTTPEITIDPNSGAYVVANYRDGKPVGGAALTRDQLMDIRGRNTDFNAWADRDQKDEHFKQQMALSYAKFNFNKKQAGAASARAAAAATTAEQKAQAELKLKELDAQIKGFAVQKLVETSGLDIDATNAENLNKVDQNLNAPGERDAKRVQEYVKGGMTEFEKAISYSTEDTPPGTPGGDSGIMVPDDEGGVAADQSGLVDAIDAEAASGSGKGKISKTAVDPAFFEVGTDGVAIMRPAVKAAASSIMADIANPELNPDGAYIPEVAAAGLAAGAIGRTQDALIETDYDAQGNPYATLGDGVTSVRLSPESFRAIDTWQTGMKEIFGGITGNTQGPTEATAIPDPGQAPPPLPAAIDDTVSRTIH